MVKLKIESLEITNTEKIERVNRSLAHVLRSQVETKLLPDLILFKSPGWCAIPLLESSVELILQRLKKIGLEKGGQSFYASVPPQFGGTGLTCEVPLASGVLEEFRSEMSPFIFVLFTGETTPNWIFISIQSDCYILVGPSEFITHTLESSIEEAFLMFCDFINSMNEANPLSQAYNKYYSFIYNQLKKYEKAESEASFLLNLS